MTEQPPWETEPEAQDFDADGLPCAMRRNDNRVWCGYVGVPPSHPWFGLPFNAIVKLPGAWFERRKFDQGIGPMDMFMHALSGRGAPANGCAIAMALQVHGGITYAAERILNGIDGDWWWFGFDCGHAGDCIPGEPGIAREVLNREVLIEGQYRDRGYVAAECQSLAAQLNEVAALISAAMASTKANR